MLFFYLPFGFLLSPSCRIYRMDARRLRLMLIVQVALGSCSRPWRSGRTSPATSSGTRRSMSRTPTSRSSGSTPCSRTPASTPASWPSRSCCWRRWRSTGGRAVAAGADGLLFIGMYLSYSQSGCWRSRSARWRWRDLWSRRAHRAGGGVGGGRARRACRLGPRRRARKGHLRPVAAVSDRLAGDPPTIRWHGAGLGGFARAALAGTAHPGAPKRRFAHDARDGAGRAGAARDGAYLALAPPWPGPRFGAGPWRQSRLTLHGGVPRDAQQLGLLQCLLRRSRDLDPDGRDRAHHSLAPPPPRPAA